MKAQGWNVLIALGLAAIFAFAVLELNVFAGSSNSTVTANVNVGNVVYIKIAPNSINLNAVTGQNSIYPQSTAVTIATNNLITDYDKGGNIAANILVEGTNFVNDSNTIGVSNTLWSATSNTAYGGTPLTTSLTDTEILIPQPSISSPSKSNNIYFGFSIPPATPAGNYIQTITFNSENTTQLVSATQNSTSANTVNVYVNIGSTCYISLSPNTITFGSIVPSTSVPTNVLVTDSDNGGNAQAAILVDGTNWALTSNSAITFGVSNTLWSSASNAIYAGNALTNTLNSNSLTGITVPAPTQASPSANAPIYFGLAVPPGTLGGSYTQTITIENSC